MKRSVVRKNFGVKEIIVKRGADDCFVVTQDQQHTVAALKVDAVVDTTAAGDSFSAGYLAKRILGGDVAESALAGHKVLARLFNIAARSFQAKRCQLFKER